METKFFAKVKGFNTNREIVHLLTENIHKRMVSIKITLEEMKFFQVNYIYYFTTESFERKEGEEALRLLSFKNIFLMDLDNEKEKVLKAFFPELINDLFLQKEEIIKFLNRIENNILKTITENILNKFSPQFFYFPAAAKMHHNYLGGIAMHTLGMLKLGESFIKIYPEINADLLFSGIIIHDILKVKEYFSPLESNFTKEGQLLGHIPMGIAEIAKQAKDLGYCDTEEILLLEHMMISHHGQAAFGSPKRPLIIEAYLLYMLDTFDSKMIAISDALVKIAPNFFTEPIAAMEKASFYKHDLNNKVNKS